MSILYIDTESDPDTKQPQCITWKYEDMKGIATLFDSASFKQLKELWDRAEAVLMFNAPYDLGVLSICFPDNSYKWVTQKFNDQKSSSWDIIVFRNRYQVRRLNFFRNLIKPLNRLDGSEHSRRKGKKSTPVIDLLKLWSILVKDEDISLKSLIKDELGEQPIPWSKENAMTEAYRLQDVNCLERLWAVFHEKINDISEVRNLSLSAWASIKTPATFTKMLYEQTYPKIKGIRGVMPGYAKENGARVAAKSLTTAFEHAYHGGITLAMYRGKLGTGKWVDISGAYSKAIDTLNTDQYLSFDTEQLFGDMPKDIPVLCRAKCNFIMMNINHSLKLFYVKEPSECWIWNFDLLACEEMVDDFKFQVMEMHKIVPLSPVTKSLPRTWDDAKREEKKLHGKTTLYQFYKLLSNSSYGIKAQRKPFTTAHTNMAIAGMITSKVHQILARINKVVRDNGGKAWYNDTDSCFATGVPDDIAERINKEITPFEVEDEGSYTSTIILSLKRYVSISAKIQKVKLHGKGRYKVKQEEILRYALTQRCADKLLTLSQMAANTGISMKQILKLYPQLEPFKHPFMFVKDVKTERMMSEFMDDWYMHIDTKTTFRQKGEFERRFRRFQDLNAAIEYFTNRFKASPEDINHDFEDWDAQASADF